jgi:N-acetylglutamate synthase-like GNAT family acetyltransferase
MINYRRADEADYTRINDFYNRIYKSARTTKQFYWEFHNAPDGRSIYIIAEDGEKIVGTNCVIPIFVTLPSGEKLLTGKSEDTLVDPDYRGRSIFQDLYQVLFDTSREAGITAIWGFTSAAKPFRKLGFEIPFEHSQSLAVNQIASSYRYLSQLNPENPFLAKLKIAGLCMLSKLKSKGAVSNSAFTGFTIVRDPITEGVEDLVAAAGKDEQLFHISQSGEFQNWRIYQNPNYHKVYTFGFYDNQNILKALIVLNAHPDGVAFTNQCIFHPDISDSVRGAMVRYTNGELFRSGIALIRNWHFQHTQLNRDEVSIYKKAGYTYIDRGIGFVWKPLNTSVDPAHFYLSRLATEGVI